MKIGLTPLSLLPTFAKSSGIPERNFFTHRDLALQLITSHIPSDNTPFPSGICRIFLFFTTPGFSHHFPPLGEVANQARFS